MEPRAASTGAPSHRAGRRRFGGASRVAFPIASGVLMDRFGVGVPFWGAALLVLGTLPLARALAGYRMAKAPVPPPLVPAPNITGEFPIAAAEVEEKR